MRVVLTQLLCALALNASALAVTPDLAAPATTMDAAGTLHAPAFLLPTSELISQEFRASYERMVQSAFPAPPASNAPREAWEQYYVDEDRKAGAELNSCVARYRLGITATEFAGEKAA